MNNSTQFKLRFIFQDTNKIQNKYEHFKENVYNTNVDKPPQQWYSSILNDVNLFNIKI